MALELRRRNRLLTVRIAMKPSRTDPKVELVGYHGAEELIRREVPAEAVGIRPTLSVREYRDCRFGLPEGMVAELAEALRARAEGDAAMWLQVTASHGHLAVVPWERHLQPVLDVPLLRIPNFLADPAFLQGPLRLVLCVSSPRAKTPFAVAPYVSMLLEVVRRAVPGGSRVHVFADREAYDTLAHDDLDRQEGHEVVIHDPGGADRFGTGQFDSELPAPPEGLESPWLQWMAHELESESADAVHFVCPGFFHRDRGALALARSPGENVDRNVSHLVGAEEVLHFLNRVGAWAVGFSPPHEDVWAIGLRLLADRIVWERQGPLFVHDTEKGSPDDLAQLYRFLFSPDLKPPPCTPTLMLYSHPKRLAAHSQAQFEVEWLGDPWEAPGETVIVAHARPERMNEDDPWGSAEGRVALANEAAARTVDRGQIVVGTSPVDPWKQASRLQLEQILLRTKGQSPTTKRGMMDAVARMSALMKGGGR